MSEINGELFVIVRNQVNAAPGQSLTLADLAELGGDQEVIGKISGIEAIAHARMHQAVSALTLVRAIRAVAPKVKIHLMGATRTVVEPIISAPKRLLWLRTALAAALLFVGSGLAIMNFHADVDMPTVQRAIYQVVVGESPERLAVMQIPYSLGIGAGILLFFRGAGRVREPGPLQLETDAYQRRIIQHYQRHEERDE